MFGLRVEDGAIHHTAVSETLTFQQTVGARLSNQQGAPPAAEPDGGTSPDPHRMLLELKVRIPENNCSQSRSGRSGSVVSVDLQQFPSLTAVSLSPLIGSLMVSVFL